MIEFGIGYGILRWATRIWGIVASFASRRQHWAGDFQLSPRVDINNFLSVRSFVERVALSSTAEIRVGYGSSSILW